MLSQAAVQPQAAALAAPRPCAALPAVGATRSAQPLPRQLRQPQAAGRCRRAQVTTVRAIIAESPVVETAAGAFPRGAHWQVGRRRRRRRRREGLSWAFACAWAGSGSCTWQ